ncbi:SIMPL domain-containing protein [Saprospira grandis]|uniref:DUF541 domain-containing protein n=1 Tax=Saprospira grandis (strain Lewin) TaxID=984262 RepID=H6L3K0_SAPGL|nr:SIMPL domain-containing protein [Saprospira grandis]AFC24948.1 hypothetical protein SGRA_2219 [Saprospira grandis str. Lewin]
MRYSFFLFLACFFLGQGLVFGQARGNARRSKGNYNYKAKSNSNYQAPLLQPEGDLPRASFFSHDEVLLEVRALSNQKASSYLAIFNIRQLGKTAEETDRLLQERFRNFKRKLQALGIAEQDIHLDMLSFVPVYELEEEKKLFSPKTYNEVPKGFEMQQNVHVSYRNAAQLGAIVSAAAQVEIYDLAKVEYFVENTAAVYEELRKEALAYLMREMVELEKIGLELDLASRRMAEAEGAVYPAERYASYQAFSSPSLDGKSRVDLQEKAQTQYYAPMPYNDFEIILNPEIQEPAVQFMYHLQFAFKLKKPAPEVKIEREKEFIWITPQGDMRLLKVEKAKEKRPQAPRPQPNTTVIPETN